MDKQKSVRKAAEQECAFVDLLNQEMKELQESQKRIEEMYQEFLSYRLVESTPETFSYKKMCAYLYDAGYRKIPEGAVVLTRGRYIEMLDEIKVSQEKLLEMLKTVEKETAEKFAERLKGKYRIQRCLPHRDGKYYIDFNYVLDAINEICKEITEGKV